MLYSELENNVGQTMLSIGLSRGRHDTWRSFINYSHMYHCNIVDKFNKAYAEAMADFNDDHLHTVPAYPEHPVCCYIEAESQNGLAY
jgi:hypothetical protein